MSISPALISVGSGVLDLVALFYPPAAPIIGIAKQAAPYIAAAIPLIEAGIKEGPGAFAAAKEAAPQLTKIIEDMAAKAKEIGVQFGSTDEAHLENITRTMFSLPRMTPEQELKWMNDATSLTQDSRSGSG